MFCMLQPTIQHLEKKGFVIEDEPKYTETSEDPEGGGGQGSGPRP